MANFLLKNRKYRFFHVTKIFFDIFNNFFEIYASDYPQKVVFRLFYQADQAKRKSTFMILECVSPAELILIFVLCIFVFV